MLKLMRLEIKKFKIGGYIRGAIIADLCIMGLMLLITYGEKSEGNCSFVSYNEAFMVVNTLIEATFIVFASVIIARFIIDEFKNKTITVLFMYPINRKKLIISKLLIVAIFTFLSILLSDIFISSILCILDSNSKIIPGNLTNDIIVKNLISMFMNALAATGMSLIPLYFGMRKKSVPTTIISSILIVSIVCSNNNGFSLNSIVAIPISLAIIGVVISYLSFRNIEHVDVIK